MVDVADRGEPVGEHGEPVSVPDENVSSRDLKRVSREVSPSPEVAEHLIETLVRPSDAIVPGDDPGDIRSEERFEGSAGAARVEPVLRSVQTVEKADGGVPLHFSAPISLTWMRSSRSPR